MFKSFNSFFIKFIYLLFLFISINVFPVFSQTLDVTFGNGGKVVTPVNDTSTANNIAIQSDGKILAGGSTTIAGKDYFALVRYNIDGSLDNTFGSGGKVVAQFKDRSLISSIAIEPDGKIVAGGTAQNYSTNLFLDSSYAIIRFKMDGSIDSLFGNNGITTVKMSDGTGELKKLLIKPDGKILSAGTVSTPIFENAPVLVQFKPNGSLDSSFGTNGKLEGYINDIEEITDIALGKDGKIYATGRNNKYNNDFVAVRLSSNGTIDSTFGTNGVVKTDFGNTPYRDELSTGVVALPDTSFILAGYTAQNSTPATFALAKYKVNGSLDSTFGTGGKVTTQIYNLDSYAQNIITDSAGGLLVSGYTLGAQQDFVIARYSANGKLDTTFGNNSIIITDFTGFPDIAYSSVLQSDGKIILAGRAGISSNSYGIGLARYTMSALPLKLIHFSANKNGENDLLQWQTAQEINVDRFEIEKSWNGMEYSTIGKINAGSSKYNFTDNKPFKGINYYRLKMVDKDGKMEYSPVRTINNSDNFYVSVYPLPAKDRLNIQIQSNKTEEAEISVTDISGKTLITKSVSLAEGLNNSVINVQSLTNGVYFLKIVTPQKTETRKIVVGQ